MAEKTKNLCAQIPESLHNRVRQEQEASELTLSQYITKLITEYYEGGKAAMENTRTMAVQIPEELFQQLKDYLLKVGHNRVLEDHVDVGIISPYKAQVQYIRQRVKSDPFFKPFRHLITINTVDGFQGQERDVIIISLVRANENGEIGFLRDLRRMNVAMTRARMKLIILGDASTLTRHPFYKKLYASIAAG